MVIPLALFGVHDLLRSRIPSFGIMPECAYEDEVMRVPFGVACVLSIVASVVPPPSASAYTLDATQLFDLCVAQSPICTGYLMGVADARDNDKNGISFCIPTGVSKDKLQDVVVTYLRKNSDRRFPAPLLVSAAFAEAFQCKNPG